jgi:hypothetical protein
MKLSLSVLILAVAFYIGYNLRVKNTPARGLASEEVSSSSYEDVSDSAQDRDSQDQEASPPEGEFSSFNLKTSADFRLTGRQDFVSEANSMIDSESDIFFEAGQGLTPDFKRANDVRARLNYCHKFIDANGDTGEWGQMVLSALDLHEIRTQLLGTSAANKAGMQEVCPRFAELNQEQRKEFWLWTMASLALFESICGFDMTNAVNHSVVGMY